jgi:hypothetical protein
MEVTRTRLCVGGLAPSSPWGAAYSGQRGLRGGRGGALQHDDSFHEHAGTLSHDGSTKVLESYIIAQCCDYGVKF